jgi:RNA polymerase sigma-70 factor (ECF subfamily)
MNDLTFIMTDMNELTASASSHGITELPVVDRPGVARCVPRSRPCSIAEVRNMTEPVTFAPDDRGFVYAVARRIVGSADDAEDVTQDALVLAYRYRHAFRGDSRYRTWLHRIAVTTALGFLRRKRRSRIDVLDSGHEHDVLECGVDPAKSPVTLIAEAEDRAAVQRALAELPPSYRDVLLERVDATEPEVAKRLGISVANVKIRAHRARKQLRQTLAQMEQAAA